MVDPKSGQPVGKETFNGSIKVIFNDGHSEIFGKDGKCTTRTCRRAVMWDGHITLTAGRVMLP